VLRAGTTHSYTGGEWTIAGEQICTDAVQAVTINGINATIKTKSETAIVIEVPAMKPGAVDVKISYNGGEIVLGDKVKVYPGNGTWKEVSPFPQTGKMESRTFVTGGKAYVLSGSQVTKPAGEYAFTYFNNIYEYDPMADTWTFKLEDESLDEIWYLASCRLGSRYVYTSVRETEMKAYDPVSNSLSSIGYPDLHNPQVGLAINDNAYVLTEDDAAYALELYKYDQGKDTWPLVNSTKPNYASTNYFLPWAPFAHEGYGYFTTAQINVDKEIWLWRFDPKDNSITKISSVGTSREAGVEFPGLEYLFTIDGLAYFIEMGSFDLDPSSIIEPSKTLYIYNFEWNEWHVVDNALPQTFYRPASFTVDNRGFLGLGLGKGPGPSYAYPNNFYEFLPE
jgi:hypothetical protein